MRPGLLSLTLVLLSLFSLVEHAQAQTAQSQTQQTTTTTTQNGIPPVPSDADLQNPNTNYSATPRVAPVQQIAPLLTPQQQAAAMANQMRAQQAAQNQAMANQQNLTPQLVPIQPSPAPVMPVNSVPTAATGDVAAPTAAVGTTSTTTTKTTTTEEALKPTTTAGFTAKTPGNRADSLPLNSGSIPTSGQAPIRTTNPGMDMSIDPNVIGGVPPVGGDTSGASTVPYEEQLRQRTQELQTQARDVGYEQAKKSVLPLETYEIRDVLGRLKDTQEAIQTPVRPAPKPSNTIETISTDPSATPKIIQLAAGNVTTLNIVDITGEPWPIVDLGFGGAFDIKPPEAGGHVIRITPLKDFARGNLVIRLLKMTTPITFTLQAGGDTVNYRFDARIPDYGPNAKMPLMGGNITTEAGDKTTTSFLEGVPPKGSTQLVVAGIDGRTSAYKYAGNLYVRTPLSLISPAWQGSATSADGMNVYMLSDAPVLLLSDKGALVRARISDAKKEATGF